MRVYVILYGSASKPELSDEIKGFVLDKISAGDYCNEMNKTAEGDYSYFWEEADLLKLP